MDWRNRRQSEPIFLNRLGHKGGGAQITRRSLLLGFPEDLADLFQCCFECLGGFHVHILLDLTAKFASVPYLFVKVRVLLKVLGLEVVGPDDQDVIFRFPCVLFFCGDVSDEAVARA